MAGSTISEGHVVAATGTETTEGKQGLFARIGLFIRQIIAELKKVVWPTRDEMWTYFAVVIVFVLVLMAIIGLFDFVFSALARVVFG